MSTYPPRECGIATFNQDLLHASQKLLGNNICCKVAAMNLFPLEAYHYPSEVEWEIDQNDQKAYTNLAKKFNNNAQITGVIIQHEYGIFGGSEGKNILSFVEVCKKPIVVTLHTVLPHPSPGMKQVTARLIQLAHILVVLTQNSKQILERVYPQSINKVHVIPHGIHPTLFATTTQAKKNLKLKNRPVLSTFGLLSRTKGIEYVLNALPDLIQKHPSILYLIIGETHPVVRRKEGESYRNQLANLVTKLRLNNHVKFYDQYLTLKELIEFLKATDIYISTSINPNQAVSGTLSYALGTGRAVISTEFAQAKELITAATGRLVPIKNSTAFSHALVELLGNSVALKKMHRSAYEITRPMLWSNVAQLYSQLLTQHILPSLNLSHLNKMTDEFGLFQFAALDVPNKSFGYTLDDNARALVVCCWLDGLKIKPVEALIDIYLRFIKQCQLADGSFINYLDYQHKKATEQNTQENLEEATARAMWGLSEVMRNKSISSNTKKIAEKIFLHALPKTKKLSFIRSSAFMIKACAIVADIDRPYRNELLAVIKVYAEFLVEKFETNSKKNWYWFDTFLTYNNAIVPEALLIAGQITGTPDYSKIGNKTLKFLIEKTFSSNRYMPIGNSHWYTQNGKRSSHDQQPEDPASMILALVSAYEITHDIAYRHLVPICFSWFLGNNSLQLPLYNDQSGGCYDGLHPDRVNLNQGAESLVSYLLSRLAIGKMNLYENSSNQKHLS